MKNIRLFLTILLCTTNIFLFAQSSDKKEGDDDNKGNRKEKIEAMKVAFLTKRLDLTADEAQRFWPVYNQFSEEREKLREDRISKKRGMKNAIEKMTDKEAEKIVDGEITSRQTELDVIKKYHAQFKQLLPIKKVALLYSAEEEFKRELLEKIKDRKDHK